MHKGKKLCIMIPMLILLIGLFARSFLLFWKEIKYPFESFVAHPEYADMSFTINEAAIHIYDLCLYLFSIGFVVIICYFVMKGSVISNWKQFLCFILFLFAILACVVPFALIKPSAAGNYLYPVRYVLLYKVTFYFLIALAVNVYKHYRIQSGRPS